ncbi:MAG: glucosaminidase domain-containing protein [Acidimicrobiales bacterium]
MGGPPSTAPQGPPPPPPDPKPILTAVDTNLAQLTAIDEVKSEQATVTSRQQDVAVATAAVQSEQAVLTAAEGTQKAAQAKVNKADDRLRNLALAAYMGLGYATPAAGPQGAGSDPLATVSTPGGLTGTAAADAEVMLRLVAEKARHDVSTSQEALARAVHATGGAQAALGQAGSQLSQANSALAAAQKDLVLVTKAATDPTFAASVGLLGIPGAEQGAGATAPAAGAGPDQTALASASRPVAGISSVANGAAVPSPTILGPAVLTGADLANWFASTGHTANTTVPMAQLAADYQAAGQQTGVRDDLAFAQSIVETGFFSFPAGGQLTPQDNNFAGIGACDSCTHGWSFPDAQTGVGAQMELLEAYASPKPIPTPLVGPVGVGGCCPTWMDLAGKWASSLVYGISIMTIYNQMLTWVIPQRLQQAGLATPAPAPAPASASPSHP